MTAFKTKPGAVSPESRNPMSELMLNGSFVHSLHWSWGRFLDRAVAVEKSKLMLAASQIVKPFPGRQFVPYPSES